MQDTSTSKNGSTTARIPTKGFRGPLGLNSSAQEEIDRVSEGKRVLRSRLFYTAEA